MTAGASATAGAGAARDWEAVRAAGDIQFAPVPPPPPPEPPPEWLLRFAKWLSDVLAPIGEWLKDMFAPLGKLFGIPWPVFEKILLALAAVGVLVLAWELLGPLIARLRPRQAKAESEWTPDHAEAVALLEDADRLAAQGRFDEATHLLLRRSVGQIAAARPDWLHPASTAREIAGILALPSAARAAFATIAGRVERSRYALRPLAAEDWQAARAAYADFALVRFGG